MIVPYGDKIGHFRGLMCLPCIYAKNQVSQILGIALIIRIVTYMTGSFLDRGGTVYLLLTKSLHEIIIRLMTVNLFILSCWK